MAQRRRFLLESEDEAPLSGWVRRGSIGHRARVGSAHLVCGFLPLAITAKAGEREGQNECNRNEGPDGTSTV